MPLSLREHWVRLIAAGTAIPLSSAERSGQQRGSTLHLRSFTKTHQPTFLDYVQVGRSDQVLRCLHLSCLCSALVWLTDAGRCGGELYGGRGLHRVQWRAAHAAEPAPPQPDRCAHNLHVVSGHISQHWCWQQNLTYPSQSTATRS
jgi:hypothetical protein